MTEKNIKISIVVPVYNVEKYISRCLDSIIEQDFADYEIICVDDCSTDGSLSILRQYERKYRNIIVKSLDHNQGLGAARNQGVRLARGKYIWYVDSDDYIISNSLNFLYELAEEKEADILLFEMEEYIEGKRELENRICPKHSNYDFVMSGKSCFQLLVDNGEYSSSAANKLFRRDLLNKNDIRFIEGIVHEDEPYTLEAFSHAEKVFVTEEPCYAYCRRASSIMTSKKDINYLKSFVIILNELNVYFNSFKEITKYPAFSKYRNIIYDCTEDVMLSLSHWELLKIRQDERVYKLYKIYLRRVLSTWGLENESNIIQKEKNNNIYIYGAGKLGKIFSILLEEFDANIKGFIVTKPEEVECRGYKVFSVTDVNITNCLEATVFIMIKNLEAEKEMRNNAIEIGFQSENVQLYSDLVKERG